MRCSVLLALVAAVAWALSSPPSSEASPYVRYGLQDDAWIAYGPGTLDQRLDTLDRLGVKVVRYTLRWDQIERRKGQRDWGVAAPILRGIHSRGMVPLVGIYGTPRWANGGRSPNWAPMSKWSTAAFAGAAQREFPFVRRWLVWNEPNQRRWLRPTSARTYVAKLLNPARWAIKRANRRALVGGGVTAPRGAYRGVSPVAFIRGMDRAGAKLDAYAHNPYPLRPSETPWAGGCGHCATITMATLERLLREVNRAFGRKRIWLTEHAYQSSPPRQRMAVSRAAQARLIGSAARRAYTFPRVDILIHYLYKDEPNPARWQSGLMTARGSAKPARRAAALPLAQVSRRGVRTVLWGQVRPGEGRQRYSLQQFRNRRWRTVGEVRWTGSRGFLRRVVRARRGAKLRLYDVRRGTASPILRVR